MSFLTRFTKHGRRLVRIDAMCIELFRLRWMLFLMEDKIDEAKTLGALSPISMMSAVARDDIAVAREKIISMQNEIGEDDYDLTVMLYLLWQESGQLMTKYAEVYKKHIETANALYECGHSDPMGKELQSLTVVYTEKDTPPGEQLRFECKAESGSHAVEQCRNSYPGCTVLAIEKEKKDP